MPERTMNTLRAIAMLAFQTWLCAPGGARAEPGEAGASEARCLGESVLHVAVAERDAAAVGRLLREAPALRAVSNALGETPLAIAARAGDMRLVQRLLGGVGPELEIADAWGATPLMLAIRAGHDAVARRILAAGADPGRLTSDRLGVLHLAARAGRATLVPTLTRALGEAGEGASIAMDARGLTPLEHAVLAGSRPTVQALLRAGAVVRPLTLTMACGLSRVDLAAWLSRSPSSFVAAPLERALEHALALGDGVRQIDPLAVSCLLDAGAPASTSVLRSALGAGRVDLAALLVMRSEPSYGVDRGDPMLHAVAEAGELALADVLLRLGVPVAALDAEGASALVRAVIADRAEIVRALVAAGADPGETFRGSTARGLAIRHGALAALAALVEARGHDLFSAAALDDAHAITRLLASRRDAIDEVDADGLTPLMVAARFGASEAARVLVEAGAAVGPTVREGSRLGKLDVSGWTALHFAADGQHSALFHWLVARGAEDHVAGDGRRAAARARFALSDKALAERDGETEGLGSEGWGFGGGWESAGGPRIGHGRRPLERDPDERPSFIALGGGLLRDERRRDEEVIPRWRLSAGLVEDGAIALESALGGCVDAGHWFEAERVARALVDERALAPLPELGGGIGWRGRALLLASARMSLARILTERRRAGEAEAELASARAALEGARSSFAFRGAGAWQGGAPAATQVLPVHRVWAAIITAEARLRMRAGQLARAAEGILAGLLRLEGEPLALLRAGLVDKLALALGEAARYEEAIAAAREALALVATHDDGRGDAPSAHVLRHNLATLLGRVGARDEARAIVDAELARVERGEVHGVDEVAAILFSAGLWRAVDGDDAGALALMNEARAGLAAERAADWALGRYDLGIGNVLMSVGRDAEAEAVLARGREAILASEGAPDVEALSLASAIDYARILTAQAAIARRAGRLDEALSFAETAYAIVAQAEVREARWAVELELGRVQRARGKRAVAIWFAKRAVTTLERMRRDVPALAARAFVDDRVAAWRELADQLIEAGRFLEATAALAAIKREEALVFAGGVTRGGKAGERADESMTQRDERAPPLALGQERQSDRPERALVVARAKVEAVVERIEGESPRRPSAPRLDDARQTLRERRRAFEAWLRRLEGELDGMTPARARAIAAMNLRDLAAMQDTLATLGQGVVMVHYLITDERVRAIVTTPDSQSGREAAIAPAELNALVFQFRQVLSDPRRDPRVAAEQLYRVLIAPIEGDLAEAGAETLLISLDGALRYAPLAALWDGRQWLVERYRVVHFARAVLPRIMAPRKASESLAAFGCGRAVPGHQQLAAVPEELEGIVKRDESDPDGELPGVVHLDDAFSRDALMALLDERRFNAVHIASHFVLGPGGEADSYLLLGDGGRLTLEEIRYDMRFDGVDLLALSACNTALGEGDSDGREIEGFASLAMRLGARAVLATLWPVSDASTGLFMKTLYRSMREGRKRSRAEVLQAAMLAFIRKEVTLEREPAPDDRGPRPLALVATGPSADPASSAAPEEPPDNARIDLSHPRYWAPFVLIGNWR